MFDLNIIPDSCDNIHSCRTLSQILWSCIGVLVASTWVIIQPNLPAPDERFWRTLSRKVGLVLVALFAPEVMVVRAAREWFSARKLAARFRTEGWSKKHAFFALMGGFALYNDDDFICVLRLIPPEATWKEEQDIIEYFDTPSADITSNSELGSGLNQHSLAAHASFIGHLPEREIADRSHSDAFSKLVAVGQTSWFIVQLLCRWTQKLYITDFEATTILYTVTFIIALFFSWDKPQGVSCHIRIQVAYPKVAAQDQVQSSIQTEKGHIYSPESSLLPPSTKSQSALSSCEAETQSTTGRLQKAWNHCRRPFSSDA
ncbi:hypothetical protein GYMLUDRAFT_1004685, partial [Collybiopsis luxurians FD-317 M1]